MLNNIVDNLKQCGQQNIVQCCFHQARKQVVRFFLLCRVKLDVLPVRLYGSFNVGFPS